MVKEIKKFIIKNIEKIGWLLVIIVFITLHINLYKNMYYMLDSDMSSEMVLSDLLAKEGSYLTKNWYYSTEIRIVYMQIILVPLFRFISNWKIVRFIGTIICNILLLLSFVFTCKKLNIKHISWLSLFIVGSLSKTYYEFVEISMFYSFILICQFLTIGLIVDIVNKPNNKFLKIILYVVSFVFSLSGIREFAVLYFPLFISSLVLVLCFHNKYKDIDFKFILKINSETLMFSAIGVAINKLVLSKYFFINQNSEDLKLSLCDISRLKSIIMGWLDIFGFWDGVEYLRANFLFKILVILIIFVFFVSIIRTLINNIAAVLDKYVAIYVLTSMLVLTGIFVISNKILFNRYFLTVYAMIPIVLGINFNYIYGYKTGIILFITTLAIILNTTLWIYCDYNDVNNEYLKVVNILEKNKVQQGYASFWEGNVLTELSNGYIETWCYGDNSDFSLTNRYKWLSPVSHDDTSPCGNIFICIQKNKNTNLKSEASSYIVYEGNYIILYIFPSEQDLINNYIG